MDIKNCSNTCRGCLSTENDLFNIFHKSISVMFTFCTSLPISVKDGLPDTLCHMCYDVISKFYLFKQKCIRSDETLRKHINFPEIKEFHESQCIKEEFLTSFPVRKEDNFCIDLNGVGDLKDDSQMKYYDEGFPVDTIESSNFVSENGEAYNRPKLKIKVKKKKIKIKKLKNSLNGQTFEEITDVNIIEYPCLECNKKFAYPERLESHKLTHSGVQEKIMCHICNKEFKQWDGLRRHREFVHMTSGKSLECPTCGKLYKTEMTLRNHQKIHQQRQDFVCHICGGFFKSAGGLQNHVDTHKENREKKFECKICNKKFVTNNYLTSHMFRHKERRFVCHICRYPFFTKADLTRHALIHNGIKPFVCEICKKGFSTKSFLIEHGRIHSGERPFGCDFCMMSFISKRRLIDHLRTHTGEKPHKCDKCDQAFIQRGSLTRHLKVHEK